ncbi:MAG: class E sortase [Candidatus Saccharimonadales bacterium]
MTKPKKRKIVFSILALLMFLAGLYILVMIYAPKLVTIPILSRQASMQIAPADKQDYIVIPKINLKVAINSGTEAVLQKGAWHRFPERGDPEKGGNFILAAHRFIIGWTPGQTRTNSPFYNINRLSVGDPISVQFNGKMYQYKITKKYSVKPSDVAIEAPSDEAKMTLYSCTFKGSADGRDVIEALPVQ